MSVTWKFSRVPREREPDVQPSTPTWIGPIKHPDGRWINSHVMNQDFIAWVGQGAIADRTKESLSTSDRGVTMIRKRYLDDLDRIAAGLDPKGVIRDPAANHQVSLSNADLAGVLQGDTTAEILANPRLRMMSTSYVFQAGQPEAVRLTFAEAMGAGVGVQPQGFIGLKA